MCYIHIYFKKLKYFFYSLFHFGRNLTESEISVLVRIKVNTGPPFSRKIFYLTRSEPVEAGSVLSFVHQLPCRVSRLR